MFQASLTGQALEFEADQVMFQPAGQGGRIVGDGGHDKVHIPDCSRQEASLLLAW